MIARAVVAGTVFLAAGAGGASPPAAVVDGTRITLAEVDARCGGPCATLVAEIAARKWAMLETLIGEALLAGTPAPPSPSVSAAEVDAYLAAHAGDFHGPPARDRAAVEFFLAREKRRAVERARIAAARARRPPRLAVAADGALLRDPAPRPTLAVAGARTIRNGDVEARLALPLYRLRGELQRERRRQVDAMVEETLWRLEAAARGTTVEALRAEVGATAPAVTDADVGRWIETDVAARDPERVRPYLAFRAARQAEEAFLAAARARRRTEVFVTEPDPPRLALGAGAGGWRGPARPRARVVFLTGYRGQGSRAMWPVVKALADEPGVALAVRPLLPFWDPEATAVAAAVRCAAAQGRFWAFHDAVALRDPLPHRAGLDGVARDVGLDTGAFAACVADPATTAAVAEESAAAEALGLESAPVVLVDGRAFGGVQSLERLRAASRR